MFEITRYTYKESTFSIVNNNGTICAIDRRYLDEAGRLTQKLNGEQMLVSMRHNTVTDILERIRNRIDLDERIASAASERGISVEDMYKDTSLIAPILWDFYASGNYGD